MGWKRSNRGGKTTRITKCVSPIGFPRVGIGSTRRRWECHPPRPSPSLLLLLLQIWSDRLWFTMGGGERRTRGARRSTSGGHCTRWCLECLSRTIRKIGEKRGRQERDVTHKAAGRGEGEGSPSGTLLGGVDTDAKERKRSRRVTVLLVETAKRRRGRGRSGGGRRTREPSSRRGPQRSRMPPCTRLTSHRTQPKRRRKSAHWRTEMVHTFLFFFLSEDMGCKTFSLEYTGR